MSSPLMSAFVANDATSTKSRHLVFAAPRSTAVTIFSARTIVTGYARTSI